MLFVGVKSSAMTICARMQILHSTGVKQLSFGSDLPYLCAAYEHALQSLEAQRDSIRPGGANRQGQQA